MADLSKPIDPLTLGIGDSPAVPALALSVSPQPARSSLRFAYTLAKASHVSLAVFDLLGRRVELLEQGDRTAGVHTVAWAPRTTGAERARAGIYFARLETSQGVRQTRVVLLP